MRALLASLALLLLSACTWKRALPAPDAFVDREAYPFESHWLEVDGGRMHYLDEGEGPVVLLVHGTPVWSFLWRDLIKDLSLDHRVIAMDHLGFGLSDKPADWAYTPEAHADNVVALVEGLDLHELTLVVHDFGGPIGLGAGRAVQERVDRVVILNTWMWSLDDAPQAQRISKLVAGPVGRYLYLQRNYSTRKLIPYVYGDKSRLDPATHEQYTHVFAEPGTRVGHWRLGVELAGASDWYAGLWDDRAWLAERPVLLGWGMKDPTFGEEDLARWTEALPAAELVTFEDAGHFVQEEAPDDLGRAVRGFLERTSASVAAK
jgi:pimeloyl-ACP methyl ester carboxylesterase